ncbi:MAG: protein kinase [Oscillospiraceae bacterium]|jgi:hypothetical protein|nr:protein kinase [Oscillospiraceae bacterium]
MISKNKKSKINVIRCVLRSITSVILISGFLGPNYLANADPPGYAERLEIESLVKKLGFESLGQYVDAVRGGFLQHFGSDNMLAAKRYYHALKQGFCDVRAYLEHDHSDFSAPPSENLPTPLFSSIPRWMDLADSRVASIISGPSGLGGLIRRENQLRENCNPEENIEYKRRVAELITKLGAYDPEFFELLPLIDISRLPSELSRKIKKARELLKHQRPILEVDDVEKAARSAKSTSPLPLGPKLDALFREFDEKHRQLVVRLESLKKKRGTKKSSTISLEEIKKRLCETRVSMLSLEPDVQRTREDEQETSVRISSFYRNCDILSSIPFDSWVVKSRPKNDDPGLRAVLMSKDGSKHWISDPMSLHKGPNPNSIILKFDRVYVVLKSILIASSPVANLGECELYGTEAGGNRRLLAKFKGGVGRVDISQGKPLTKVELVHIGKNTSGTSQMHISSFKLYGEVIEAFESESSSFRVASPKSASDTSPVPAIVLARGLSSSRAIDLSLGSGRPLVSGSNRGSSLSLRLWEQTIDLNKIKEGLPIKNLNGFRQVSDFYEDEYGRLGIFVYGRKTFMVKFLRLIKPAWDGDKDFDGTLEDNFLRAIAVTIKPEKERLECRYISPIVGVVFDVARSEVAIVYPHSENCQSLRTGRERKSIKFLFENNPVKKLNLITSLANAYGFFYGRAEIEDKETGYKLFGGNLSFENLYFSPDGFVQYYDYIQGFLFEKGLIGLSIPPCEHYKPPESVSDYGITPEGDVFRFGCILYEILTEELMGDHYATSIPGTRPEIPEYINPTLKDIIFKCWSPDPCDRYHDIEEVLSIIGNDPSIMNCASH